MNVAPTRAERTKNAVRLLRALTPKARRRKMPRKRPPTLIERDYADTLKALTLEAITPGMLQIMRALPAIIERAKSASRVDELGATREDASEARAVVDIAYRTIMSKLSVREIAVAANRFAHQVSTHNEKQLGRQLEAVFGVPVAIPNERTPAKIEAFIEQNVSLVLDNVERFVGVVEKDITRKLASSRLDAKGERASVSVKPNIAAQQAQRAPQQVTPAQSNVRLIVNRPEDFNARELATAIERNVFFGGSTAELAEELEERFNFTADHAAFIARDQVGTLNGQLDAQRQQGLGVTRFTWVSVGDDDVREEHDDRDGEIYDYDDPPDGELPGEPINCRCSAEPVLEDLIDDIE